ncbi:MAG: CCA tRNA nucleotidyltransferase [Lachnospiraceae bacterium]|nr:CCA tRNA nucleotidyltransferase [Lachnospiraceae bacterium]
MTDRKIQLPEKVKQIINCITEAGYEAYAVGGCIRDSILGRVPDDWDITTSATPQQVKRLFRRTIDTGIQHGTVTVMLDREGFEVTTYRIDGKYEDGRHPTEVTFTPNLEEDLKRRDFTINAMAYNEQTGLVDLFGGIQDIEAGIIRCVGDARARFTEDALRIMRAIRFAAQLGYRIEGETREAISELAPNLRQISAERIQVELTKLVNSAHPETMRTVYDTGVAAIILPEFQEIMETAQNHPHHCYSVGEHTLCAMQQVERKKELRLTMLFHDIGKPQCLTVDEEGIAHFYGHAQVSAEIARKILRRLRYDNDTTNTVYKLVLYHDSIGGEDPTRCMVRRAMNKIGEDIFPMLFAVRRADILAQSETFQEEKLKSLAEWQALYEEILERKECVSLKTLALTGSDLIALGMKPGKALGETLHEMLELVLDHPEYNTREYLTQWLQSL